jgi:2-methylcitrate dehydratase
VVLGDPWFGGVSGPVGAARSSAPPATPWVSQLADHVIETFRAPVPDEVLDLAALHLLDSLACVAGAIDSEPVAAARRVVAGSGPAVATVLFGDTRVSSVDAVLVNGTALRFLDANDIFLGVGPGGHPSDNIVVALAVGEEVGASGRDVLAAIALSYELVSRIRSLVYRPASHSGHWHEVSLSGTVAAAMSGLLYGLDRDELTHALAIATAKGYVLKQVRRGTISAMKATANALVARDGVLAAQLARAGLSGPPEVFEGEAGLFKALGLEETAGALEALTAPPEWMITHASIKPFPGLGTSQAAVHAAVTLTRTHGRFAPGDIARVAVRLVDSDYTRDYRLIEERRRPQSRETADHSIQYLVSQALLDGDVTPSHYERETWTDDGVRAVMAVTEIVADPVLTASPGSAFPAVVEVERTDGSVVQQVVQDAPGSPAARWNTQDVVAKLVRFDRTGRSPEDLQGIAKAVMTLSDATNLSQLTDLVRA